MQTIWKYPLEGLVATVRMPHNAQILTVQMQQGVPCLWALVDPDAPTAARRFVARGTGQDADGLDARAYCGTVQQGGFVWHLFEVPATPEVPSCP